MLCVLSCGDGWFFRGICVDKNRVSNNWKTAIFILLIIVVIFTVFLFFDIIDTTDCEPHRNILPT
jgi:uncharacterized protein YpmS